MAPTFNVPTLITFGDGSLDQLTPNPGRIVLVLSSAFASSRLESLKSRWGADGIELSIVKKAPGEPQSSDIDAIGSGLPSAIEGVVGIGGGSVMDFAKALAILSENGGSITDYEFGSREIKRMPPLYMAPTTCGSGSEVTPYAVINNSTTGRKFTLAHPLLRPTQAAIDPELLRPLPGPARLATGLDAFTHCLEAVLTRSEVPLVAPLAEAGLSLAWTWLSNSMDPNPDEQVLVELARLSVLGGISVAHSRTGLIHTLSVALAPYCDLPHGLLNARLLPFALSHNLPGYDGLLASVVGRFTGIPQSRDDEALQAVENWLEQMIGIEHPVMRSVIMENQAAIVARLMQDKGLPAVSHGVIDENALTTLVRTIADAAR